MKVENGKLVDYNYYDIKEIIQEAMTQWKKQNLTLVIQDLKEFVAKW